MSAPQVRPTEEIVTEFFDNYTAQVLDVDPAHLRLLWDRVVVRDIKDDDKVGSLFVPMTAKERGVGGEGGVRRTGIVVAVGPGDKYIERYKNGEVRRRPFTGPCPMQVSVGDRVVYDRRKEAEVYFNGERYSMMFELQAIYGRFTKTMDFKPLYDRLVVRRADKTERMGRIVIPENAKETPQQGRVVAVGPGRRVSDGSLVALDIAEGDRVLFGKHSGAEIELHGETLLIMREEEVLGVLPV